MVAELALREKHRRVAVVCRVTLLHAEDAAVHYLIRAARGEVALLEEAEAEADLVDGKVCLA